MAAHAVLGVFLLEFIVGTSFEILGFQNFVRNVLLCMTGYVILSLVIWRGGVLLKLGTVICCVLGIAEYYVLEFRGLPIVLTDVLSIGTAADVSDAYAFDITPEMIAAVLLMLSVFLLESKIRFMKYSLRLRGARIRCAGGAFHTWHRVSEFAAADEDREGWKLFLESSKVLSGERLLPEQLYLSEIPVRTEAGALF